MIFLAPNGAKGAPLQEAVVAEMAILLPPVRVEEIWAQGEKTLGPEVLVGLEVKTPADLLGIPGIHQVVTKYPSGTIYDR